MVSSSVSPCYKFQDRCSLTSRDSLSHIYTRHRHCSFKVRERDLICTNFGYSSSKIATFPNYTHIQLYIYNKTQVHQYNIHIVIIYIRNGTCIYMYVGSWAISTGVRLGTGHTCVLYTHMDVLISTSIGVQESVTLYSNLTGMVHSQVHLYQRIVSLELQVIKT